MTDALHLHVIGQVVNPGDRLLVTFPEKITMATADRIQTTIRDKLGAEAVLIGGANGVMILPPHWQPPPGTTAPDRG